ncbi:hypothetical protein E3P99_03084 [Wallemia hederae]|uniref:AB hydrolase-1 domain-containing protein n=1 Tax=Wallemia hederae TaxID=1540922 RepID=A0A4T0FJ21_9BASI|nr:hypothetical protein E3P99_03084 [Wallemia hederae]
MDFNNPDSFTVKETIVRGLKYRYADVGVTEQAKRGTFLLIHGYPDTWFSWHRVAQQLVSAGYRCIIPSTVGYCGTESPDDLKRYTRVEIARDMAALLDELDIASCHVVGHDWGSMIAQRLAGLHADKVQRLILLSIPYLPPAKMAHSIDSLVANGANLLRYQLVWRDDATIRKLDSSEDLLKSFFANLFSRPSEKMKTYDFQEVGSDKWEKEVHPYTEHRSSLLKEHYDWHVKQFRTHGMRGPCSYYKVWELNSQLEAELNLPTALPVQYCLQILFAGEPVFTDEQKKRYAEASNDHHKTVFIEDGETHWYMLEKPDLVASHILEWVGQSEKSSL